MKDMNNVNLFHLLDLRASRAIKNIVSLLKDKLVFLLVYGSSVRGVNDGDIDVYAVIKGKRHYSHLELGRVDLLCIDEDFLLELMNRDFLDPALLTEPLLTGFFVSGDRCSHDEILKRVSSAKASLRTISYLSRQSFTIYLNAVAELDQGRPLDSLVELTFAVSYYLYAQYYLLVDPKVITLEELISRVREPFNIFINDLFSKRKYYRRKSNELETEKVLDFLNEWERLSVSGSRFF